MIQRRNNALWRHLSYTKYGPNNMSYFDKELGSTYVALKMGNLLDSAATTNFQRIFLTKFDSKLSLFQEESLFLQGFITENPRGEQICPLPWCKMRSKRFAHRNLVMRCISLIPLHIMQSFLNGASNVNLTHLSHVKQNFIFFWHCLRLISKFCQF